MAWRYAVLGLWAVVLVVSGIFGPRLLTNTTEVFSPPPDTEASLQNAAVGRLFPSIVKTSALVLFIESTRNVTVLGDDVKKFSTAINASAYDYHVVRSNPHFLRSVQGYYTLADMGLETEAREAFVSPAGTSTMILFTVNALVVGKPAQDFANYLITRIDELKPKDGMATYTLLGAPAFLGPATKAVEADMGLMDGIVLPIAIFILWFMLRTWRLMLLPLATVVVSALAAFAVMYGVSLYLRVFTVVPSLMMSLVLAISIDYSLFMLVRYRVELQRGRDNRLAVIQMTRFAGKTIGISGVVLGICFFGLAVYPVETIRTMGYACGTVVVIVLAANETLIPVILLTLPRFFEKSRSSSCYDAVERVFRQVCCFCCAQPDGTEGATGLLANESQSAREDRKREKSWWLLLGRTLVKWPWNLGIIVLVVAASIPFDLKAFDFATSDELVMDLPRGDATSDALQDMIDAFGYGTIFPYKLIVQAPGTSGRQGQGQGPVGGDPLFTSPILDEVMFVQLQDAIGNWKKNIPFGDRVTYEGIMYAHGTAINASAVQQCKTPTSILYNFPECKLARMLYDQSVNSAGTVTVIVVTPQFFVTSETGRQWLDGMRADLVKFTQGTGVVVHLIGPGADSLDTIKTVFDTFPIMITITCCVVFTVMAASFRSLLIPVRSVVTIAITLLVIFGFANLTYEHDMLGWLQIAGLKDTGTIVWLAPMTTFTIVVGVSLDYDVFLVTSIEEECDKGHGTHEAVARGLYNTGYIITAAGIIMAVAFSGLVMASIGTLNQFGFYLVWAVLLDTFVVRSLLVPAVMGMLGDSNFYPGSTGWCSCRRRGVKGGAAAGVLDSERARKDALSRMEARRRSAEHAA